MKIYKKEDFPVSDARRFLEPSPAVLLSSAYKGKQNVMTMGWYTIMEFVPSLVGCMISAGNYSFDLIENSGECVLNIPTAEMAKTVVSVGNCSGSEVDKFAQFNLTTEAAVEVQVPLIKECFASFECKVYDRKMIDDYNFFIMKIVKAHVSESPEYPATIHYRGDSIFMTSGENIRIPSLK